MTPSAGASSPAASLKPYQCGVCDTSYTRPDHLIRHMSTHTKQKPFNCRVCSRAFARPDLLKRHSLIHRGVHRTSGSPQLTEDLGRHGPRVQQACRSCASKKLRCSDSKPCQRCVAKNLFCDYEQTAEPSSISMDAADDSNGLRSSNISEHPCSDIPATSKSDWAQGSVGDDMTLQSTGFFEPVHAEHDQPAAVAEHQVSDHDHIAQPGDPVPSDIWGCTFDLPNLGDYIQINGLPEVDDLDMSFFQDECSAPTTHSVYDSVSPRSNVVGVGSEAYASSDVRKGWNPGPNNNPSQPRPLDLPSIPKSDIVLAHHSIRLKVGFKASTRDKLLAMIYDTTSRSVWERISVSFASLEMLTSIIQHALWQMQVQQAIPFIHVPSFDVNSLKPELVGALIAYGAVCARSASLRDFGYGIHEVVRLAVNRKLESEEAAVRDPALVKTHYILLYIGFWSAISAKIEVAESSSMLGATMLRRGKFLQAGSYQSLKEILPIGQLPLARAWREWAQAESNKRLVYFAVHLDAQISLARKINPLFAYSEVSTPLPAIDRLWNAGTAERWHEALVPDGDLVRPTPPANAILRQPRMIVAQKVDTTIANAAMFAQYWAMVYDYRQMEAVFSEAQDRNSFVLQSRYAELLSLLEEMKAEVTKLPHISTQVAISLELLLLHLNVAYYDISAYCGRGTIQEAEAAKSYVQWWVNSEQSRHALFHAGQIFRLARTLKPASLIDISSVALYHATETLWIWGMMQRVSHTTAGSTSDIPVALDAEDDPGINRYLRNSYEQVGLTGAGNRFVSLTDPAAVSDLANGILSANFGSRMYPRTTSEVARIVQGFSRIGRSQTSEGQ